MYCPKCGGRIQPSQTRSLVLKRCAHCGAMLDVPQNNLSPGEGVIIDIDAQSIGDEEETSFYEDEAEGFPFSDEHARPFFPANYEPPFSQDFSRVVIYKREGSGCLGCGCMLLLLPIVLLLTLLTAGITLRSLYEESRFWKKYKKGR